MGIKNNVADFKKYLLEKEMEKTKEVERQKNLLEDMQFDLERKKILVDKLIEEQKFCRDLYYEILTVEKLGISNPVEWRNKCIEKAQLMGFNYYDIEALFNVMDEPRHPVKKVQEEEGRKDNVRHVQFR